MPQSHIPIHAHSRFKAPLSALLCRLTASPFVVKPGHFIYAYYSIFIHIIINIGHVVVFCVINCQIWLYLYSVCPVPSHHSPTCSTLSTQPLSSRAMPRRKGSRVSSLLSPLLPISSPPVLNDEYMQISRSLLGKDQ